MKLGQIIALQAGGPGSGPRTHTVFISKSYFPKELHPKGIGKEAFEQVQVKAKTRTEAAQNVWAQHGDRWLRLMGTQKTTPIRVHPSYTKIRSEAAVKKCPFCGTNNNIKLTNSDSVKCKNCDRVYMSAGGPGSGCTGPDCGRHTGTKPAQHMGYRDFEAFPGEKQLDFAPYAFRDIVRKYPKDKIWVVYSLGSSWHDPQEMFKIAHGPKVPDGVQEVTTALEYRAAWRHIQQEKAIAFSYSRNFDR